MLIIHICRCYALWFFVYQFICLYVHYSLSVLLYTLTLSRQSTQRNIKLKMKLIVFHIFYRDNIFILKLVAMIIVEPKPDIMTTFISN